MKWKKPGNNFISKCEIFLGGHVKPRGDDSDQNFVTSSRIGNHNSNSLAYGMLCDAFISVNQEKEWDKLTGNHYCQNKRIDYRHRENFGVLTMCTWWGSTD